MSVDEGMSESACEGVSEGACEGACVCVSEIEGVMVRLGS